MLASTIKTANDYQGCCDSVEDLPSSSRVLLAISVMYTSSGRRRLFGSRTYQTTAHEPVVRSKCIDPPPHSHSRNKRDPRENQEHDSEIEERDSLTRHFRHDGGVSLDEQRRERALFVKVPFSSSNRLLQAGTKPYRKESVC